MKIIIILACMIFVILLAGCKNVTNEDAYIDLILCHSNAGKYWDFDTQSCKDMEPMIGCIDFDEYDRIDVINLPKGYENVTNHHYCNEFMIRVMCAGDLVKHSDFTCEESGHIGVSYYHIRIYKQVQLCWG